MTGEFFYGLPVGVAQAFAMLDEVLGGWVVLGAIVCHEQDGSFETMVVAMSVVVARSGGAGLNAPAHLRWNRLSFVARSATEDPTAEWVTWDSGAVKMVGADPCGWCAYNVCCHNNDCCDNVAGTGPPCDETGLCENVNPMPTPAPPDPEVSCDYRNHECNPLCDPYSFEGGEIWRGIDTDGYKNLVVEIDLAVSGLSAIPHGRRPTGAGYNVRGNTAGTIGPKDPRHLGFLPWSNCTDIFDVEQCVDCWLIEELISVYYTTEYESPYNGHNPVFSTLSDEPAGINLWKVARAIPRSVLLDETHGYTSERTLTLDFQMQDDTDWRNDGDVSQNPDFGIWIRCLLDSDTDEVLISRVAVKGIPVE